ncbi:hypothetical protein K439DRAFT_1366877 [Ramaria rubella]|nr:hypothetical protein K439DRAFT_1366877 [Ramaria rubella]
MSTSKIPHIYEVIPIIDVLTAVLDKYASNQTLFPAVHSAAAKGHKILNKYYSLTDESIVYRIAMILIFLSQSSNHPHYKTLYFQQQKWPDSWVDTVIKLVQEDSFVQSTVTTIDTYIRH